MRPAWPTRFFCMDPLIDRTLMPTTRAQSQLSMKWKTRHPSLSFSLSSALWIVRHQALQSITPNREALAHFEAPFLPPPDSETRRSPEAVVPS